MGRAQLRTLLPLILLSFACSDENPLDVHQIGLQSIWPRTRG